MFKKTLIGLIASIICFFVVLIIFKADNYARRQVGGCEFLPVYEENARHSKDNEIKTHDEIEELKNLCMDKNKIYWDNFLKALLGRVSEY